MDKKLYEKYKRALRVFGSMFNYIESNILKENTDKADLISDFEAAEEAIAGEDWESQVKNWDGEFLPEKQELLIKMDRIRPLIAKVKEIKTFW